ncbi:MAG: DUF4091 domain-containing protein [Abditibacteriota bacterium]|nr:DUF4091 domain-containing protein [Abditibacteriota bacterium]
MKLFIVNSTTRIFPSYDGSRVGFYDIYAARNENVNWQVMLYNDTTFPVKCKLGVKSDLVTRVRLEQLVFGKAHTVYTEPEELDGLGLIPGLLPDPLIDEDEVVVYPFSNRAFWINSYIPADHPAGSCPNLVECVCNRLGEDDSKWELCTSVDINVADFTVAQKKTVNCLHWFYCDSLADYYRVEPFTDEFWPICEKYMQNYSDHGNTIIYLPLFTPPLDGIKRPNQLVGVERTSPHTYAFDFTLADKYVELAHKCGLYSFECVHFFTQWGCAHPIRIYADPSDEYSYIFDPESDATGDEYREFLSQFLPALKAWAEERGIFDNIWYHMSDEPHGDEHLANYKKARDMIRGIAPWMKTMDALSDINIAREAGVDMPISSVSSAPDFIAAGMPHWVYYCCGPKGRHVNRFLDTPLWKERMLGAAMYKLNALGFLQWGYNYWYRFGVDRNRIQIDPYADQTNDFYPGLPMGDAFEVYPSLDGPVDSLRWEVFRELLEDFDLFTNLGVDKASPLLKDIIDYAEFPRDPGFIHKVRKALLEELVP